MNIILNGQNKQIQDVCSVAQLASEMQNTLPKIFVIEINETVIYKEDYETTVLNENDKVEVVAFAGGG